jgi:FAD/FMN-containing dehydrogenase
VTQASVAPTHELEHALRTAVGGEVRFDRLTRRIYSTDASIYSIEPIGWRFPHCRRCHRNIEVAKRFGVPVLPRGAGPALPARRSATQSSSISRSTCMRSSASTSRRAGRVQPGLVQDDLNAAAARHGLMFAPDTSTANRATLGGMIGNNSCGSRSARYGMTIDHVSSLDVVLSDGSRATLGSVSPDEVRRRSQGDSLEARLYRDVPALAARRTEAIRTGFPPYWRRSGGYRLERLLPDRGPFDLSTVVVGSEGTLAITTEATVKLVPLPKAVAALAGHFEACGGARRRRGRARRQRRRH